MIRAFINKIISLAEGSLKLNIAKKIQINRLILKIYYCKKIEFIICHFLLFHI